MTRRYQCVAVLYGGPSVERDVSLKSGRAVAQALETVGYDVVPIDVTDRSPVVPSRCEAAFIALHGAFGEDGAVQCLLEARGIPYTGAGPDASRAAMDKAISKKLFQEHGIPTPDFTVVREGATVPATLPVVIKPPCQGSTIGMHVIRSAADWEPACRDALKYDDVILVENYVGGREFTVGVLGDDPLPVIEIEAPGGWFDYEAKYTKGKTAYRVPAEIPAAMAAELQETGLRAYRALGCRGMGRVDFRLDADGRAYVLEVNTIPGFTETSLLPMAAAAAGITFPALCDRIMQMASL